MKTSNGETTRPTKLAHIALRTNDRYDTVCDWYRDVLGVEFDFKGPMACFMTFDEEHHRVAVVRVPGMVERPPGTVGIEHIAFTFADLNVLLETYERLKRKGIEPIIAINHGATTSLYYEDPDRNRVELQVDNFKTAGDLAAFFQSGVLDTNPVGVSFVPDDMLAKLRAGVPAETLQAYPRVPGPVAADVVERLARN